MDITLAIINICDTQYGVYIEEIMESNLPRGIKCELKDLLKTALMQADQARDMGWLPQESFYTRLKSF
jgi:hypothetical protein